MSLRRGHLLINVTVSGGGESVNGDGSFPSSDKPRSSGMEEVRRRRAAEAPAHPQANHRRSVRTCDAGMTCVRIFHVRGTAAAPNVRAGGDDT